MASRRRSESRQPRRGVLGSVLRQVIPARWRRPLIAAPVARAVRTGAVDSLSVRPPWWRLATRMLIRRARPTTGPSAPAAVVVPREVRRAPLVRTAPLVPAAPRLAPRPTGQTSVARSSLPGAPAMTGTSLVHGVRRSVLAAGDRLEPGGAAVLRAARTPEPVASTPVARWRAAIARQPLESPQPFPAEVRPLVAELAGSADRPSFTTGPATRAALLAAGAAGATTGSVVHLPEMPSARPDRAGVLAHELSHARNPVTRPRFLLHSTTGAMDADERVARGVGARVQRAVTGAASAASGAGGGAGGAVAGRSSMLGAVVARSIHSGPSGDAGFTGGSSVPGRSGVLVNRAPVQRFAVTDRLAEAASSVVPGSAAVASLRAQAQTIAAGIVDSLPVGGAGAAGLVDAARPAALSALTGQALPSAVSGAAQNLTGAASALPGGGALASAFGASGFGDDVSSAEQQVIEFGPGGALDALTGAADQTLPGAASTASSASAAGTPAAGLLSGAAGAAQQVAGAVPGAAGALSGVDLDRITAALEERLLRQLERRGGRYAGVF